MKRIENCFAHLKQLHRAALIPYITAGDPDPKLTVDIMHTLVRSGADLLELGVPFSDPMADGPAIQAACERALLHNVSLPQVLTMVSQFRQNDAKTPVILMGYLNPLEVMGHEHFASQASVAGVDGVITVDMPPEEGAALNDSLKQCHIDPVFLLAPTSTPERIALIAEHAQGFLYYVSLKGVTGSKRLNVTEVKEKLAVLRQYTTLPIGVGFGIHNAEQAAAVGKFADAVVVGSALIKCIEQSVSDHDKIIPNIETFMASLSAALE